MALHLPMNVSGSIYRLLLILLGPALLLMFIWQGWKNDSKRYPLERLGLVPKRTHDLQNRQNQPHPVWFHAASVGEINGIVPLLRAFIAAHPEQPILLTTTTISGFESAQRQIPEIEHLFLPFDFNHAVRRFLGRVQPQQLFVMETEIWPTLFKACAQQGVSINIINGRLSHKTLSSPAWVRRLYREALGDVTAIAARSDVDREGFVSLGADPAKCKSLGNIKYAASGTNAMPEAIAGVERPTVIAASTRDDEEQIIASAWQRAKTASHLLVIVPRHPERLIDILKDLASYKVAIRSRGELPTDKTEIYLADTFGELKSFMAHSELVIMGGSFVARGGQNLIEPAAMGRAIIVGPHMENFAEETQELLKQQALIQLDELNDGKALSEQLTNLLGDPELRSNLGERARQCVIGHADVVERYMSFIEHAIRTPDQSEP